MILDPWALQISMNVSVPYSSSTLCTLLYRFSCFSRYSRSSLPYWILPDMMKYTESLCLREICFGQWLRVLVITTPKPKSPDRSNTSYWKYCLPLSSIFRLLREGPLAPSCFVTESVDYALGQDKFITADNAYKRLLFLVLSICIIASTFLCTPPCTVKLSTVFLCWCHSRGAFNALLLNKTNSLLLPEKSLDDFLWHLFGYVSNGTGKIINAMCWSWVSTCPVCNVFTWLSAWSFGN